MIRMFCALLLLLAPAGLEARAAASETAVRQILSELQELSSRLEESLNRFEAIETDLDRSGRSNKNYDDEKNIWISTILSIATIASVCEYENDLVTLFVDLKPRRRIHFYDVRLESLEVSIHQVRVMQTQIQINYSLLSLNPEETLIFTRIEETIAHALSLLTRSRDLVGRLKTLK